MIEAPAQYPSQNDPNFLIQQTAYLDHRIKQVQQRKIPRPARQRKSITEFDKKADRASFQLQPATENELAFRHSNWKVKRALVQLALQSAGTTPSTMERFANCGGDSFVDIDPDSLKLRVRANYCHCRHCEPCMRSRANLLAANLRNRLEATKTRNFRFVTLTLKHSTDPLRVQINRLYACFKKLRANPVWKLTQEGGATVLEVKWKPGTQRWHPHLHIIAQGNFMRTEKLSAAWLKATGDSTIVDIRQLTAAKDAAHYVAKYMSKGTNNEVWTDPAARTEWVTAMKGVRACATFGTWRGFKLLDSPEDTREWKPLGTLDDIVKKAYQGDTWAIGIVLALKQDVQYDPHRKRPKKTPLIE